MADNTSSSDPKKRAGKEIVAGSFGGICQVLSGQPFDTVKVRIQTQAVPDPGKLPKYNGVIDCVRQTFRDEGWRGFYKGTLTPLLGVGVCVSIQFAVLEHTKRVFQEQRGDGADLKMNDLYLSGAIAGLANSFVSGPVEHIRTRLQVQSTPVIPQTAAISSYSTHLPKPLPTQSFTLIRHILSHYGLPGLYKGQVATMVREFHGYGIYFSTYEAIIRWLCKKENKKREELDTWKIIATGAGAGYALWISIFPIDTIKSKLQTDSLDASTRQYSSIVDCVRKTLASDGIRGLWRGFLPCILRAAPVNGVTFAGFEIAMRILGRE